MEALKLDLIWVALPIQRYSDSEELRHVQRLVLMLLK
jgi:hypothetical protein